MPETLSTPPAPGRTLPDLGVIIALAWVMAAIGVTVLYGGQLGFRGWVWLGVHHVACAIGCTHELWQGWKRRQRRVRVATPGASPPA